MARGQSTDHAGSKNKGRSRSQSKTRKLKCYHCHKEGHYRKDCPERKGEKKDNSKTADAGVVKDNFDGADVLSVTISSSDGGWILDTGCSYHMCTNRDWPIPELRKNLISLGTLDSNGCSYRAAGGVMRIMKGALVVMKGLKQNSLYLLQGSTITGAAAIASSSDIDSNTTKVWHMHLGHMSERGMDVLSKQGLLGSKKIEKLDFCEHCVFGKQCRVKFSRAVHTTKGKEDYILSDLWGPSTVPSKGGGRYMLTFIDDFSRKVWVIFNCPAYAHVNDGKLEPRAKKCIFLGYANGVKGYRLWCLDSKSSKFLISRDVTFDESSMLSKKELIDVAKDHGVREKVELEVRAPNSLPIIPTDKDFGSHSTEENEESQEQQYNIARNRPTRDIRPPQKYVYADMVAYALSVAESIEVEKPVTYKEAIKSTESTDMMTKHIPEIKFKHCLDLISINSI
ncbi:hypothetical protein RJ639_021170 [Escallonia herrerae]|uniref:CCHC-type domain-containing protein n=1 Tax=Escallonia herrerae TaxID=1293975 RepID=A0AA89AFV3_9ASTE|nr:hypothetical protein RJ639_021170 [Escallonia herrerae]